MVAFLYLTMCCIPTLDFVRTGGLYATKSGLGFLRIALHQEYGIAWDKHGISQSAVEDRH